MLLIGRDVLLMMPCSYVGQYDEGTGAAGSKCSGGKGGPVYVVYGCGNDDALT